MLDATLRKLVANIVATNEIGSQSKAYMLSHARTPKSGYSVGAFQLDLASRSGAREAIISLLNKSAVFNEDEITFLENTFTVKGDADAIDEALQAKINIQLSSELGHGVIDALDGAQLDELIVFIQQASTAARANPRYASDPEFKDFSNSVVFKCLIGDNTNQFGGPVTFKKYIQGEEVTVGGTVMKLGGTPWDVQAFANYEANYAYTRDTEQGASDMRRRRRNVINILAEKDILVASEKVKCLEIIQATYKSDQ